MVGILLVIIAEVFSEVSTSFGKFEAAKKKESLYAFGFLNAVWSAFFLFAIAFFMSHEFVFSFKSLPTFLTRLVLEIVLLFITLHAVLKADRSTFSFLRALTIPLLLAVDLALGFSLSTMQIAGISLICVAILLLAGNHDLRLKGMGLSITSAILAVCTISLYKYDITHFNSVEAEQGLTYVTLLTALVIAGKVQGHENVFRYLGTPLFLAQSLAAGVASVLLSFSYLYAPASVITTAKRSFEIVGSIVAGRMYFHERHLWMKIVAGTAIMIGIALTVL